MDQLGLDKTIRGQILEALDMVYPGEMSDESMMSMLRHGGIDIIKRQLRAHIAYLAGSGKEYVTLNKLSRKIWLAKLTPKGKDLLVGVIGEDPGIIVNSL